MKAQTQAAAAASMEKSVAERVNLHDWDSAASDLDSCGFTIIEKLLTPAECRDIAALYPHDAHFRSHIRMSRHGFGRGEYKYFSYPLPDLPGSLRSALYPRLAPIANGWNLRMGTSARYPEKHADFLRACHQAG